MNGSERLQGIGRKKRSGWRAGEKGAVLVALIVGMTVAAGLGAAVMKMNSSSSQSQVVAQDSSRALYVAEGGARYIIQEIQDDINAGVAPSATVTRLHGQIYPLGTHQFEVDLTYVDPPGEFRLKIKGIINQQSGAVTASANAGYAIKRGGCGNDEPLGGGGGNGQGGTGGGVYVCETNDAENNRTKYGFASQQDANQIPRKNNWRYWGVTGGEGFQGTYQDSPCVRVGVQNTDDSLTRKVICHKPGTPAEKTKSIPVYAWTGHQGHGDTEGACVSDSGKNAICHEPPGNPANRHTIWVSENARDAHLGPQGHGGDTLGVCPQESPWVEGEWCVQKDY